MPEQWRKDGRSPGRWVDGVHQHHRTGQIVPDMDSSGSPTYGNQEGAAYNGHLGEECHHPLFCFNQFGDLEGAMLRPGNVHSAEQWDVLLEPIVERYRSMDVDRFFRGDAVSG